MLNMQQQFDVPASCLAADGIACCSLVWSMCKWWRIFRWLELGADDVN